MSVYNQNICQSCEEISVIASETKHQVRTIFKLLQTELQKKDILVHVLSSTLMEGLMITCHSKSFFTAWVFNNNCIMNTFTFSAPIKI